MSVEGWARREADRIRREDGATLTYDMEEDAFAAGIVHAFDALLSDEAVSSAEAEMMKHGRDLVLGGGCACGESFPLTRDGIRAHDIHVMRAALQAAVRVVTEGGGNA